MLQSDNTFLKNITHAPGIYMMLDAGGKIMYVGKANNLKKRLQSYFRESVNDPKTKQLVSHIAKIEVIVTHNEKEALLLEANLIKAHKPKYNIILKDDKSYPYIVLTDEEFPALKLVRGRDKIKGTYYGPYPSASSVRESIIFIQKLFKLRVCSPSFFKNRTRPCLEYQIARCSAPCVNLIKKQDYSNDLTHAKLFLSGKNDTVIQHLSKKMQVESAKQNYELAANFRDQVIKLNSLQEKQSVYHEAGNMDVLAFTKAAGVFAVSILMIRNGKLLGNKYFCQNMLGTYILEDIIENFLMQYYLNRKRQYHLPEKILLSQNMANKDPLKSVLQQETGTNVNIIIKGKEKNLALSKLALINAENVLHNHLNSRAHMQQKFSLLKESLGITTNLENIVCFDVSHSFGEATVASCVAFSSEGPQKNLYRRFNIKVTSKGDDYAALGEAITRYIEHLKSKSINLPDLLLIDGGKGQLSTCYKVLNILNLPGILALGIAKGPKRKSGEEQIFVGKELIPLSLDPTSAHFHLLQQIRDEAHRYAISAHRNKRDASRLKSKLENIEGIGKLRRARLLERFGSVNVVKSASIQEIAKTPGISLKLAKIIFDELRKQ